MTNKTDASTYTYRGKDGEVHTMFIPGHRLLVRKCRKSDDSYLATTPDPDKEYDRFADTMLESLQDNTMQNICEVLAVGPDCGKPRSKAERKRLGIISIAFPVSVGQFVVLPETGEMWNNATENLHDIIVDESEILCVMES